MDDKAISEDSKDKKNLRKKKKFTETVDVSTEDQISIAGRKRLSLREISKLNVRHLYNKIFTFD